jgi:hypothetical protein
MGLASVRDTPRRFGGLLTIIRLPPVDGTAAGRCGRVTTGRFLFGTRGPFDRVAVDFEIEKAAQIVPMGWDPSRQIASSQEN